jgi:hypothetical protein
MLLNLNDEQKFQLLKEVYIEHRKEVKYWPEHSWKVTIWLISLMITISASTLFVEVKTTILFPVVVLTVLASLYLNKNYITYTNRWRFLADIENALGFFEKNIYIEGDALYKPEFRTPKVTYDGTVFFILAMSMMAFSVILIVLLKDVYAYFHLKILSINGLFALFLIIITGVVFIYDLVNRLKTTTLKKLQSKS